MSLINQMLSDLEARKSGQSVSQKEMLTDTLPSPRIGENKRGWIAGSMMLLILIITALVWWQLQNSDPTPQALPQAATLTGETLPSTASVQLPTTPTASTEIPVTPQETPSENRSAPAAIRLQQVRHEKLLNGERIILEFNETPDYHLDHNKKEPVVTLQLDNATNTKSLSLAALRGKLIKDTEISRGGDPLHIRLLLHETSDIKAYIKDASDDANPQLVIELAPMAAPTLKEQPTTKPPVTPPASRTDATQVQKTGKRVNNAPPSSVPTADKQSAKVNDSRAKKPKQATQSTPPMRTVSDAQRADALYQRALAQLSRQEQPEASTSLTQALTLDPNNTQVRYTLAALLITQGHKDGAEEILRAGLQTHPGYAPFAMLYSRIKIENNALAEATTIMESALLNATNDPDYLAQFAALYQRQSRHADAARHYLQALQLNPAVGVWWMGLGISLEHESKFKDALSAYQRALNSGGLPTDVLAYVQERIEKLGKTDR